MPVLPGEPFNVVEFEIPCPFDDGETIPMKMGWVNRGPNPTLNLEAPVLVAHLQLMHGMGG